MTEMKTANVLVHGTVVDTITVSPFDIDYFNTLQERYTVPLTIGFTHSDMVEEIRTKCDDWQEFSTKYISDMIAGEMIELDEVAYESHRFRKDLLVAVNEITRDLACSYVGTEIIPIIVDEPEED